MPAVARPEGVTCYLMGSDHRPLSGHGGVKGKEAGAGGNAPKWVGSLRLQ